MPLAAGVQLESMLALAGEPLELAHLVRQLRQKVLVFDVQRGAFADDAQVGRVVGPLGQQIAVENEIVGLLVGRDVGLEDELAVALVAAAALVVHLAGHFR